MTARTRLMLRFWAALFFAAASVVSLIFPEAALCKVLEILSEKIDKTHI